MNDTVGLLERGVMECHDTVDHGLPLFPGALACLSAAVTFDRVLTVFILRYFTHYRFFKDAQANHRHSRLSAKGPSCRC
jgi:hypothetical protein